MISDARSDVKQRGSEEGSRNDSGEMLSALFCSASPCSKVVCPAVLRRRGSLARPDRSRQRVSWRLGWNLVFMGQEQRRQSHLA